MPSPSPREGTVTYGKGHSIPTIPTEDGRLRRRVRQATDHRHPASVDLRPQNVLGRSLTAGKNSRCLTRFTTPKNWAQGAVNIVTRFANSRMIPQTDNPDVARRMAEIWREIDGHNANAMMIRQSLIYGFSCGEWVSDDLYRMTRVVVPPSIEMRKLPDRQGNVTGYIQLPGWTVARPVSLDGRKPIPPAKIIDVIRDPG